ncbi:MAG: AAA-like domain-containing protein [Synechococcus sp.]|nr:AAA-like domain-containing protein [Synechococcus sp.]
MVEPLKEASPYQVGGSLSPQANTYVTRQADEQLYQALKNGQFSYVLTSRQMGKSSLRVRTMARLEAEGYCCVALDFSALGTENLQRSGWYKGLFYDLVKKFHLDKTINRRQWWQERDELAPVQRFYEFFREVLLPNISAPIIIFIDEIDTVLGLPFSVDDFFIFIRSCYNERADNPELARLGFALFGVATPADLIQNKRRTPFNIGQGIELHGFGTAESKPLMAGLIEVSENPQDLLQEILAWTGGQPFLTQKVCALVQQQRTLIPRGHEATWLADFLQEHLIRDWERHDEPEHLRTLQNRILSDNRTAGLLLGLYQRVLMDELVLRGNEEETLLRLTGLIAKREGKFEVFNAIYAQIFNLEWVQKEFQNLRPYGENFRAWVESGYQDESRLLRGQALLDAVDWASRSKVISPDDYRFLNASRNQEQILTNERLEFERQSRAALQKAREAEIEKQEAIQQANITLLKTKERLQRQLHRENPDIILNAHFEEFKKYIYFQTLERIKILNKWTIIVSVFLFYFFDYQTFKGGLWETSEAYAHVFILRTILVLSLGLYQLVYQKNTPCSHKDISLIHYCLALFEVVLVTTMGTLFTVKNKPIILDISIYAITLFTVASSFILPNQTRVYIYIASLAFLFFSFFSMDIDSTIVSSLIANSIFIAAVCFLVDRFTYMQERRKFISMKIIEAEKDIIEESLDQLVEISIKKETFTP